jgi:hypothetical protein
MKNKINKSKRIIKQEIKTVSFKEYHDILMNLSYRFEKIIMDCYKETKNDSQQQRAL